MSGSVTIEESPSAAIIIDVDPPLTIEFDGGSSSLTIDQSGTNVYQGAPGAGGFSWTAPSAQSVWMVTHNLGRYPVVSIRDSGGELVAADVQYLDQNTLTVTFNQPVLGSVDLA